MKKRILIIGLSPVLGGVETYLYNLIKYIDRDEYNFDFLIVGNHKSVFEKEINEIINDGENHFYYCPNLKSDYLKGKKWIREFYGNRNYDYIYLNTCTAARIQYCTTAIRKGSILISHSHNGNGDSKINNALFKGYLSKKSKYKLSCSDLAAKWLYGNKFTNYKIIPNGIDTERFKYNEKIRNNLRIKLKFNHTDIVLGHVGRFSEQKNHKFFIEIAKELSNRFKFLLIGDGDKKSEFINMMCTNKLEDRFVILSAQDDIEKYYNVMDLFLMPSLFEGLPIVSVEAQCNGLSCVFSDTVSKQSNLSDRCRFIPTNNLSEWKKSILKANIERFDGVEVIKRKGFDVMTTVKTIQELLS